MLVFGGESKKGGVRGFGACTWLCQLVLLLGSIRKSSVGACKSFYMNFNSFKIVDSGLP